MGTDKDGDGKGEPVMVFKKPNVGKKYPIATPAQSVRRERRDSVVVLPIANAI